MDHVAKDLPLDSSRPSITARKIYRSFEIECIDGLWEMDRRAFTHLPPKLMGTFPNQDAIERAIDSYFRAKAIDRIVKELKELE